MNHLHFEDVLGVLYNRIPQTFRRFVSPFVEPTYLLLKRWFLIIAQLQLPVYILHGKETKGEYPLVTGVIGKKVTASYLRKLLYSGKSELRELKKTLISKVELRVKQNFDGCNLAFIDLDEIFFKTVSRQGFFALPKMILFVLDLSKPYPGTWNLRENKSLRENLRKMKRHGYSYEITTDPSQFENFYFNMYLPYQTGRHAELLIKVRYQQMKMMFEKGILLEVKRGNDCLAANLICFKGSTAWAYANGVKDGNVRYLKEGALTASYYYTILWAKEMGFRWLDFGHARPFHSDGLFLYKKRWGMEVRKSKRIRSLLGLKVCKMNRAVENFLSQNPFVFCHDQKLKTFSLAEQNAPVDQKKLHSLTRSLLIPGIYEIIILTPSGFTKEAKRNADLSTRPKVHLVNKNPDEFFECLPHSLKEASSSWHRET